MNIYLKRRRKNKTPVLGGGWRVYISSIVPVTGADIDYLVGVATVRDSDGKVDFIKKP